VAAFGYSREKAPLVGILPSQDKKKDEVLLASLATLEAAGKPEGCGQPVSLGNLSALRAQLARVTGSPELASDLLQDAVVTTLQKLRAGEIRDPAHLDGYVYRVALNHLRNHQRKDKSHVGNAAERGELTEGAVLTRPVESLEADQWARLVKKLLLEVTRVRDRELLVRFYLHEEPKEDLCRAFGLTEQHFNRVMFRARERFRALLQQRGVGKADLLSMAATLILASQFLGENGLRSN
jgi:RNA polymerase sigma-70 factor (ECF subfamily)